VEVAALAVLHDDIDSDILLIDLIVEVPEDVDVVHANEGIDLIDDMLLLLGGEGGEGDLLEYDCSVAVPAPRLEQLLPPLLHDIVSLLHL
jgi:hypothetical protein